MTETDADWVRRQMTEDEEAEDTQAEAYRDEAVDLDEGGDETELSDKPERAGQKISVKAKYVGLAAAGAAAVLAASAMFYAGGCQPDRAQKTGEVANPVAVAVAKPAPSGATTSAQTDRPLPYTADVSGSCPAGSTSAQTMDGSNPHQAFVCVRDGLDGQVITIDLPKTYVIAAIVLTPGWVGNDPSGAEQWSQHRVVTTVQYTFNDSDRTLITEETGNVHGEATQAVRHVMASRITMLIRQTSRPPAQPESTPAQSDGLGGFFGQTPAPSSTPTDVPLFAQPNADSDPVDATFAISRLKIIGHEAI